MEDHIGIGRNGNTVDVVGAVEGIEGSSSAGPCHHGSLTDPDIGIHIGPQPVVPEVDGDGLVSRLDAAAVGADIVHIVVAGGCNRLGVGVAAVGAGVGGLTGGLAGGSLGLLGGVAVAQSGGLIAHIAVTAVAGVGGVAAFGAGGSSHLGGVAVTQSIDLLGVALAADGAGVGHLTGLGTGGSLGLLAHIVVVAVDVQDIILLNAVALVPDHPVAVAVSSVLNVGSLVHSAGSIVLGAVEDHGSTLRDDDAVDVVGAVIGVEGSLCAGPAHDGAIVSPDIGMDIGPQPVVLEVNGDVLHVGIRCAADGTGAVDEVVTQSVDGLGVAVTAGAGIGHLACLGAGGSLSLLAGVAVTQGGHFVSHIAVAAGAGVSGVAGSGAGGLGDHGGVAVAQSRDALGVAVAAGAGEGHLTGILAGGSLSLLAGVAVTQGSHFVSHIAFTAVAGVSGVAGSGAGGLGDHGGVAVVQSRDALGVAVAADRAGVGDHTGLGAGGSLGLLGGVVVVALGDLIAEHQSFVIVHHQSEGDLHAAGNEQLVGICQAQLVIVEDDGLAIAVALSLIPAQVVAGLDEDIAIALEGSDQLAVHELVDTQVGGVIIEAVVHAVDPADQVVVALGAAGGTGIAHIAVAGSLGVGIGVGVITLGAGMSGVATLGAGRIGDDALIVMLAGVDDVAQSQGVVGIDDQSEGHDRAAGNEQLLADMLAQSGVLQDNSLVGAVALGHVPGPVVVSLDGHIAVGGHGQGQLAVHELQLAQEVAVVAVGVVSAVDIAEEVVLTDIATVDAGVAHIVVADGVGVGVDVAVAAVAAGVSGVAALGAGGGSDLGGVAVAQSRDALGVAVAADGAGVGVHTVLGAGGSLGLFLIIIVYAGVDDIAQHQGLVIVHHQSEGDADAGRHEHLVGIGDAGIGVVQGSGLVGAVAVGHVPGGIVAGLDEDIAVLLEDHGDPAAHELVVAQVGVVFFTAQVSAVDPADQVVLTDSAAGSTGVAHIAVAGGLGVGVHIAVAAGAGMGGVAAGGAGGLGHNSGVAVAQGSHLVSNIAVAAGAGVGGVTLSGTGGGSDLGGVAVAGGRNVLGLGLAAGAAGEGLDTLVGAGGSLGDHAGIPAVAQGCLLVTVVAVAAGAGVHGVTGSGAGGSNDLASHMGMGVGVLDHQHIGVIVEGEGVSTAGGHQSTVAIAVVTDELPTDVGGLDGGILDGAVVAHPGAVLHDLEFVRTGGQYNIKCIAVFGPGHVAAGPVIESAVDGHDLGIATACTVAAHIAVTGSRNSLGVAVVAVAAGVGLDTIGGAGSSDGHLGGVAVTQSAGVVILVGIAASAAGVGGITLCGTGGSSHLGGIAVAQLGDDLGVGAGADRAGVGTNTVSSTGRLLGHLGGVVMGAAVAAVLASAVLVVVTQSSLVGILIGVGATGTSVGGVALCGTGGGSHHSLVIVAQLGDGLGVAVRAAGAGEGLDAVGGTGGSSGHLANMVMAQSGHFIPVLGIAAGAGVNGVALGGAGGSYNFAGHISVDMVIGDDQHIGVEVEGEVVGAAGGNQSTVAVAVVAHELPTDVGGLDGGILDGAVVAHPGAVLHDLELVGTGIQLDAEGVAGGSPGHVVAGPFIEGAVDGNHLGVAAVAALAAHIVMTDGRDALGVAVRAVAAGVGPNASILAGGSGGHLGAVAVTQSVLIVVLVGIVTLGASISGVALSGTGGGSHLGAVAVAGGGDGLGLAVTADSTGEALGTGGGTGRLLGHGAGVPLVVAGGTTVVAGAGSAVPAVTGSGHIGVHIAVRAAGAGVSGVALSGTSGLGHGSLVIVAQLGDDLSIAVRAARAGVGLHAVLGAGSSGGHLAHMVVTQSSPLIPVLSTTTRTGINGVTLGGTGGSHHSASSVGMGVDILDHQHIGVEIEGEGVSTTGGDQRTVAVAVVTDELPTDSGSLGGGILDGTVVAHPGAVLHDLELVRTSGQYNIKCIAGGGPGHVVAGPVIESAVDGNHLGVATVAALAAGVVVTGGRNALGVAVRAVAAGEGLDTVSGTGGSGGHLGGVVVAGCILIRILIGIGATGTSVSGVALSGTGGGSHLAGVAVTGGRNGHGEAVTAVGGGLPGVLAGTGGGTGSCLGHGVAVIRGVQLRQGNGSGAVTLGASALQAAGSAGGGVRGHRIAVAVTGSILISILIGIGAAGTGMGGVTLSRTGRSSHHAGVAVTQLGDGLGVAAATVGASVGPDTVSGTGSFLGHLGGIAVTGGAGVGILISVGTLGASVGGVTLSRTGGSSHLAGVAVTGLGDGLGVAAATVGAGVGTDAVLGTGGGGGHLGGVAVTQSGLLITLFGSAASTGVGGVALGRTGGGSHRTGRIGVGVVVGDDQHIRVIHEGEVIGTAGGDQSTIAGPVRKLPANGGSGSGGILDLAVVTQPGAVLDDLEGISTGRQGHAEGVAVAAIGHVLSSPAVERTGYLNGSGISTAGALAAGVAVAGGSDALGILIRAGGAGIGANAGRGTGSGGGHLGGVAVTQSAAGGGAAGGAGLGLGAGGCCIVMARGSDLHIPVVSTVIGNAPGIATRTGCSTGGGLGYLISMVSGSQLADGDVAGGAGTTGTSTQQRTGGTGGGVLCYLISIVVAQSAAGGAATVGALLCRSTSCGCIVMAGSGNGTGEAESTIGGRLPHPLVSTVGCTGSCRLGGSGVIGGGQLRQRHRSSAGATGASTRQRTGGTGGGVLGGLVAVAMTQCAAGGSTAGAGLRLGTGSSCVAVTLCRDGRGKGEGTIGGGVPLPGVSTGGSTSGCLGLRSSIVGSGQLRQRHRGGAGTTGASTRQRTGGTGGGVLGCLIAVAMAQSAAAGSTTDSTLLSHGTGSVGIVVVRGLGDGLGLGTGTPVTGVGLDTRSGTGSRLGHGAAVPAVGTSTPSTVFAVPPTGLHGVHTAGISGNRQVRGLVPLIIPAVGGVSAVHTAENNIGVAGGHRAGIDIAALRGHTDPFTGSRTVIEEVRSETGTVRCPFTVDLQNQLRGSRRVGICRPHHAEDYTDRADQQQDA